MFFLTPGGPRELKLQPFESESKPTSDLGDRFFRKNHPEQKLFMLKFLRKKLLPLSLSRASSMSIMIFRSFAHLSLPFRKVSDFIYIEEMKFCSTHTFQKPLQRAIFCQLPKYACCLNHICFLI